MRRRALQNCYLHLHAVRLALLLCALIGASAGAADWDPNHSVSGAGSGGSGWWFPSDANWYPGTGSTDFAWTPNSDALFAGNPGWVMFDSVSNGPIAANSMTFSNGGCFLLNSNVNRNSVANPIHTLNVFNLNSGLLTYHCNFSNTNQGSADAETWNIGSLNVTQGAAMAFLMSNLGNYKFTNQATVSVANRLTLPLYGANAAFLRNVTPTPNYNVSIVPCMVYQKALLLPWYSFVGYDAAGNSLRALCGVAPFGIEENMQMYNQIPGTSAFDNIRISTPQAVNSPTTINSLVLEGCGYDYPGTRSTADVTGSGELTVSSGGILFLRGPENFSNPVKFPHGVEGRLFVGNNRPYASWQSEVGSYTNVPTIRAAFSGDTGLTITAQPFYNMVYDAQKGRYTVTTQYDPDPITLTGNSTYTGITTLNAAVVKMSIPANFGNSSMIVLNAGTSLSPTADNFLSASQGLTMNPGSILDAAHRTTTVHDVVLNSGSAGIAIHSSTQLHASGNVFLNGATLNFILDSEPSSGATFPLITGAASVSGSFTQGNTLQTSFNGGPLHTFGITISTNSVVLTEGGNGGNTGYAGTPYGNGGAAWPIPGLIDLTNYDNGGKDVAFHDNGNDGPFNPYANTQFVRADNIVHIVTYGDMPGDPKGNGYAFGAHNGGGNWLKFTVNVARSGTYDVQFRYANADDLAHFHVEFDGTMVGNIVALPMAGNWSYFTPIQTLAGVNLTAGQHVMRVFVENGDGSNAALVIPWLNFVQSGGGTGPTISTQPASVTVTAPGTATFTVAASGNGPLTYQWTKNGVNISGATSSSYTTPATTAGDNGELFAVLVGDSSGSVTSSNATLTVSTNGGGGPTITNQPASVSVTAPNTATFSVAASGGTGALTYQWTKNGGNISGATSPSYTTPATTTSDSGELFAVIVTDATAKSVTSSSATLTVTGGGGGGGSSYGNNGNPWPIPGQIFCDNYDSGGEGVGYHDTTKGDAYGVSFRNDDVDVVTCNDAAPNNGNCIGAPDVGEWLNYSVAVASTGTYTIQVREAAGNGGGLIHINIDGVPVTTSISMPNTGNWSIWYTASVTGVNLTAGQHVMQIYAESGGFLLNWINFTFTGGGTVPVITSPTTASGTVGQAFNYTIVASMNPTSYTLTGTLPDGLQFDSVHGVISGTPTTAGGPTNVTLKANNASGSSAPVTVGITIANAMNHPPVITSAALATPNRATVGQSVAFTVAASDPDGNALYYSWAFGDGTNGSGASATHAYSATGNYSAIVTVSDGLLSTTSSVAVTITSVVQPPSIVTQPSSLSVTLGQTATFTVEVSGTATLTYQWTRNGTAISGATNATYTTPATSMADSGAVFAVTVTNSAGHVTSNNATLTVNNGGGGTQGTFANNGNPWPVPGLIFCDNYNTGGEGVAYHSLLTASPYGYFYNRTDGVSLYPTPDAAPTNGFNVINTAPGQWLNYTINVTTSGTYSIQVRESAANGGGTIHIEVDGVNVTGPFYMPNTGSYAIYYTATATGISLTAGQHVLRIVEESGGYQLNWINIVAPVAAGATNVVGAAGSASNPLPMTVSKMKGLTKSVGGRDRISVSGIIPNVPKGFDPSKKVLTADIGGASISFTLDSTGRGHSSNGSASLKFKPALRNKASKRNEFQGGNVTFTIHLQNGSWAAGWGLTPDVNGAGSMNVASLLTLDGTVYAAQVQVKYKAKAKIGGTFGK